VVLGLGKVVLSTIVVLTACTVDVATVEGRLNVTALLDVIVCCT